MSNQNEIIKPSAQSTKDGILQLSSIELNPEYAKEWNADKDFVVLSRNGEILRNTLYRVGGMNHGLKVGIDKYFMLLKYTEDIYTTEFIKKCYSDKSRKEQGKLRKHLKHQWVIVDIHGNEKVVFDQYASPYLDSRDAPIYHLNNKYYNIETGYYYGNSHSSMKSSKFLFLDNQYDEDKSKRGVLKIDMTDGSFELFK